MPTVPIRNLIKRLLPPKAVHAIQQWLLRRHVAGYRSRVVRHRYGAHEFSVWIGDNLAEGWYDHDWEEPAEITMLEQWSLKPGALAFDLGAHQGVLAMMLAAECRPGGKVLSVEGSLHNVLAARRNAGLNHVDCITTMHAVVGGTHGGELRFSSTLDGQVQHDGTGDLVPCVSIDGLAREHGHPALVFLDVEGYECQALAGARDVLMAGSDFFVEVHVGVGLEENGTIAELLGFFDEGRYALQLAAGEGCSFSPWQRGQPVPDRKFFLLARYVNRASGANA